MKVINISKVIIIKMAQIIPYRQQQPIGAAKTYTTLGDHAF